jgi:hypothetical protein
VKPALAAALFMSLMSPPRPAFAGDAAASRQALREGSFAVREELRGVHPRLFAGPRELEETAAFYRENPARLRPYLPIDGGEEMTSEPVPLDRGDKAAYASIALAKIAVAYRLTGEQKYLDRLRQWLPAMQAFEAQKMESLGSSVGLTAGHVLLGFSIIYDVLKGWENEGIAEAAREILFRQGIRLFEDLTARTTYPYEQNHLIIPVCGLAVASMTVVDEFPEAERWGVFSQNLLTRSLEAIAHDGWFFEGQSYWNYTMQFPTTYAAALRRTTGTNLLTRPPFAGAPLYLAHITLPRQEFVFDFADWGPRVERGQGFQKGYDRPWHTVPSRVKMFAPYLIWRENGRPAFLFDYVRHVVPPDAEMTGIYAIDGIFGMLLRMPFPERSVRMEAAYEGYPSWHYFPDMEVVHWRNDWRDPKATAIAFKSGPPAGHFFNTLLKRHPDWKPSLGHAHPDAGSFILFSQGVFLANDTGYTGKKETADHNSLLVDGIGQHRGGTAWQTFEGKPYAEYDKIRMESVWLGPSIAASTAQFADAYANDLKLSRMERRLVLVAGRFLVIADRIASELPHEYEWRLHGDKPTAAVAPDRFVMENGPARLITRSLRPVARTQSAPTIVETQLYPGESRPQQRGHHLALVSPRQENFQFITAHGIQSSIEDPAAFQAWEIQPGKVQMEDGGLICTVWFEQGDELDGSYAYTLGDASGRITAAGLCGKSLRIPGLELTLAGPGQATVRRSPEGAWLIEQISPGSELRIDGQPAPKPSP